jgi:hypothetical protein
MELSRLLPGSLEEPLPFSGSACRNVTRRFPAKSND